MNVLERKSSQGNTACVLKRKYKNFHKNLLVNEQLNSQELPKRIDCCKKDVSCASFIHHSFDRPTRCIAAPEGSDKEKSFSVNWCVNSACF